MNSNPLCQQIEAAIGAELTLQDNIWIMMRRDTSKSYVLNGDGQLIGLNLADLNLGDEQLTWLANAQHLEALNLSGNAITRLSLTEKHKNLKYLHLCENNALGKLSFSAPLDQLNRIEAYKCNLEKIHFPDGFKNLAWLDLSRNEALTSFTFEGLFPRLAYLDLSDNQLTELNLDANALPEIQHIYLGDNPLTHDGLKIEGTLPKLATLHLANTSMTAFPYGWLDQLPKLESLYLYGNDLPIMIAGSIEKLEPGSCLALMNRYAVQRSRGVRTDWEYRVLLIGNGNTGKTSFVRRLVYDTFDPDHKSTQGIQIEQYPSGIEEKATAHVAPFRFGQDPVLNIWDFGGQDIYHATHRLFMQKDSLYLLMWTPSTETGYHFIKERGKEVPYPNSSLDYWMSYASKLGKKPPIILVQTNARTDGMGHQRINDSLLNQFDDQFLSIQETWIESGPVDKTIGGDNGYPRLWEEIKRAFRAHALPNREGTPDSWISLRKKIRHRMDAGEKAMELSDYQSICSKFGLEGESAMDALVWLVNTGVVFYRENYFQDMVLLDQAYAIDAIYAILNRNGAFYEETCGRSGIFSGQDLANALTSLEDLDHEYKSKNEHELILDFMLSCEMCFELKPHGDEERYPTFEERKFIAIQLLPNTIPGEVHWFWKGKDFFQLRYEFKFLHEGVIQSFIAKTHEFVNLEKQETSVWRFGILLEDEQKEYASVQANLDDKYMLVKYTKESRSLANKIRNLMNDLEDDFELLVSLDGKQEVHFAELEKYKEAPDQNISCRDGVLVPILPYLQAFSNVDKQDTFSKALDKRARQNIEFAHLEDLLADDKVLECLDILRRELPNGKRKEANLLRRRWQKIQKLWDKGTVEQDQLLKKENQIVDAIQNLMDEMKRPATLPIAGILSHSPLLQKATKPGPSTPKSSTTPIYFSYAWGKVSDGTGHFDELVESFYQGLSGKGFNIKLDKREISWGDNIRKYMDQLVRSELILVFISKKYFKSPNCMYELYKIYEKCGKEDGVFEKRILPIRIENDLPLNQTPFILDLQDYWKQKYNESKAIRDNLSSPSNDHQYYITRDIRDHIDQLRTFMIELNAGSLPLLQERDFQKVEDKIRERLGL